LIDYNTFLVKIAELSISLQIPLDEVSKRVYYSRLAALMDSKNFCKAADALGSLPNAYYGHGGTFPKVSDFVKHAPELFERQLEKAFKRVEEWAQISAAAGEIKKIENVSDDFRKAINEIGGVEELFSYQKERYLSDFRRKYKDAFIHSFREFKKISFSKDQKEKPLLTREQVLESLGGLFDAPKVLGK
tara:strand:+ start:163 stop:729 length:567 start_codon:yes stop_codon:yes gene_type:complete